MFKIFSCVLIISSTCIYSLYLINNIIKNYKYAKLYQKMLVFIENRIVYQRQELSEILKELKNNNLFKDLNFLHTLKLEINFLYDLKKEINNTSLNQELKNLYIRFFENFGKLDAEGEIKNIKDLKNDASFMIEKYKSIKDTSCKLYLSIGFFSGFCISMIIL